MVALFYLLQALFQCSVHDFQGVATRRVDNRFALRRVVGFLFWVRMKLGDWREKREREREGGKKGRREGT